MGGSCQTSTPWTTHNSLAPAFICERNQLCVQDGSGVGEAGRTLMLGVYRKISICGSSARGGGLALGWMKMVSIGEMKAAQQVAVTASARQQLRECTSLNSSSIGIRGMVDSLQATS